MSFQSIRATVQQFVKEREWEQFHTPRNVALALSGECGELCEIFQWMGDSSTELSPVSEAVRTCVGEEVADVLIYSVRLAHLCHIDLTQAVYYVQAAGERCKESEMLSNWTDVVDSDVWGDLTFDMVTNKMLTDRLSTPSGRPLLDIRSALFSIQGNLGVICNVFNKNADENIRTIRISDRIDMAVSLAYISLALVEICVHLRLCLTSCVSDKISKNRRKYPKDQVRGSSAKYTEYREQAREEEDSVVRPQRRLLGTAVMMLCVGALAAMASLSKKKRN